MTVYSHGIIYNDRIATITISRQLQNKVDNYDRLLFNYAKSTMVLNRSGQDRYINKWMFQSHYFSQACEQEKTKDKKDPGKDKRQKKS